MHQPRPSTSNLRDRVLETTFLNNSIDDYVLNSSFSIEIIEKSPNWLFIVNAKEEQNLEIIHNNLLINCNRTSASKLSAYKTFHIKDFEYSILIQALCAYSHDELKIMMAPICNRFCYLARDIAAFSRLINLEREISENQEDITYLEGLPPQDIEIKCLVPLKQYQFDKCLKRIQTKLPEFAGFNRFMELKPRVVDWFLENFKEVSENNDELLGGEGIPPKQKGSDMVRKKKKSNYKKVFAPKEKNKE